MYGELVTGRTDAILNDDYLSHNLQDRSICVTAPWKKVADPSIGTKTREAA